MRLNSENKFWHLKFLDFSFSKNAKTCTFQVFCVAFSPTLISEKRNYKHFKNFIFIDFKTLKINYFYLFY